MTRIQLIDRVVLAALGFFIFYYSLDLLNFFFHIFRLYDTSWQDNFIQRLLSCLFVITISLAISYIILFRVDNLTDKLTEPIRKDTQPVSRLWVIGAYRMVFLFLGLFEILNHHWKFIINAVAFLFNGPKRLIQAIFYEDFDLLFPDSMNYFGIASEIAMVVLSVYLIIGAPHYLRWLMRKHENKKMNSLNNIS